MNITLRETVFFLFGAFLAANTLFAFIFYDEPEKWKNCSVHWESRYDSSDWLLKEKLDFEIEIAEKRKKLNELENE